MGKVDKDIETLVSEGSVMPDGRRADTARAQLEYKNQLKNAGDIYVGTGDYIVNSDGTGNEIYITEGKNIQAAIRDDINNGGSVVLGIGAGGLNSAALGHNANASGIESIALGNAASASGVRSIALGNGASASGWYSTALGNNASASMEYSTALGYNASAISYDTIALGHDASAGEYGSIALGYKAKAIEGNSIALGNNAKASWTRSIALGNSANASANNSIALGHKATASNASSIALGAGSNVNANGAVQIGEGTNSVENSLQFRDKTVVNGNGEIAGDYPLGFSARVMERPGDNWPMEHADLQGGTFVTDWSFIETNGYKSEVAFVSILDEKADRANLNLVIDGNIYVDEGKRRVYAEGDKVGSAVNADNATNAINTSFTNTPWKSGLPEDIKLTEFGTYQFIWYRINLGLIYWDGNIAVNGPLGVLYEGTASSVEDGYTFFIRITSGGLVEIYNNLSSGPVKVTTSVALKYRKIL